MTFQIKISNAAAPKVKDCIRYLVTHPNIKTQEEIMEFLGIKYFKIRDYFTN